MPERNRVKTYMQKPNRTMLIFRCIAAIYPLIIAIILEPVSGALKLY